MILPQIEELLDRRTETIPECWCCKFRIITPDNRIVCVLHSCPLSTFVMAGGCPDYERNGKGVRKWDYSQSTPLLE